MWPLRLQHVVCPFVYTRLVIINTVSNCANGMDINIQSRYDGCGYIRNAYLSEARRFNSTLEPFID